MSRRSDQLARIEQALGRFEAILEGHAAALKALAGGHHETVTAGIKTLQEDMRVITATLAAVLSPPAAQQDPAPPAPPAKAPRKPGKEQP
ncbi:MAG TPA: hypothetical protein VKV80_16295 [Streptosporangiaceae bacterium]|jgi:hypothetical protein|nr:hypothetical protein [Streptosporangiaceae bacterium]